MKASVKRGGAKRTNSGRQAVLELDEILLQEIPVLDRGFVRVIDYMGSDEAIVQAARVSYGRGTKKVSEDRGLIRYLLRNSHTSPFEMAEIKLHVKLPIFVARQWIRHRTASVNEYSARYSILDNEFYLPKLSDLAPQSKRNRQGRSDELDREEAEAALELLRTEAERSYAAYQTLLNRDEQNVEIDPNRKGLARELARMAISLNFYTQWYWKIDVHNLMRFVRLRSDEHAQYEIRAYANVLLGIIRRWMPLTYEAFVDYQLNSFELSGPAVHVVRRLLRGGQIKQEESGLSVTEWQELMEVLYPEKETRFPD